MLTVKIDVKSSFDELIQIVESTLKILKEQKDAGNIKWLKKVENNFNPILLKIKSTFLEMIDIRSRECDISAALLGKFIRRIRIISGYHKTFSLIIMKTRKTLNWVLLNCRIL